MKPRRRLSIATALTTIFVVAVFVVFAPEQLGGQANYIVVNGGSMEPGFHKGDLAIVRQSSSYQVGDVATYRHPEIGHVIHRIIATDDLGRFVFQGDNNDYIDPYHPARSEMVGRLWIHIPKVGGWMGHLREPRNAAIVVFFALLGLGGGGATAKAQVTRKRRRRRRTAATNVPMGRTPMNAITRYWQDISTILGVVAAGSLLLALVAFNRPTERAVPQDLPYTQSGEFTYTAPAPDSGVYDAGAATPGEPVFRWLNDGFSVGFEYRFESAHPHEIWGSYSLVAEVGDDTGWRRTWELQPVTAFQGDAFQAAAAVSLQHAQELIDTLQSRTGVSAREYSLVVRPEVALEGTIDGEPFTAQFAPALPFEFDELQVRLAKPSSLENDPLKPLAEGVAPRQAGEPNTLSLLVFDLAIADARLYSVSALGLCLALGGLLLIATLRTDTPERALSGSAASRLKLTGVVTIRGGLPPSLGRLVDVASLDDLARIAEATGGPVLQQVRPGDHSFFVCDGDLTYRFHAGARPRGASAAKEGSAA